MKIQKGTRLKVRHSRSGTWYGVATDDFDTESDDFYPIILDQDTPVEGLSKIWFKGDVMPSKHGLCKITPLPLDSEGIKEEYGLKNE